MIGDAGKINFLGRAGDDTLEGADGDDVLDGGAGSDTLDGGDGWDGVWYSDDEEHGGAAGVVVNLELGTATDGFGDTDTLIGIEWVSGTAQADTLTGADSATEEVEWFAALDGNDTIDGGTGGFDIVSYSDDDNRGGSAAVVVNLSTGTATDGFGSIDTLIDIEAVDGTRFGDHLIGDGLRNQLQGLDGDDILDGNGSDIVGQGGFVDNLIGGAGNDAYVIDIGDEFAWINNVSDASLGETNTLSPSERASTRPTFRCSRSVATLRSPTRRAMSFVLSAGRARTPRSPAKSVFHLEAAGARPSWCPDRERPATT